MNQVNKVIQWFFKLLSWGFCTVTRVTGSQQTKCETKRMFVFVRDNVGQVTKAETEVLVESVVESVAHNRP